MGISYNMKPDNIIPIYIIKDRDYLKYIKRNIDIFIRILTEEQRQLIVNSSDILKSVYGNSVYIDKNEMIFIVDGIHIRINTIEDDMIYANHYSSNTINIDKIIKNILTTVNLLSEGIMKVIDINKEDK